jgi:hypothetical protein
MPHIKNDCEKIKIKDEYSYKEVNSKVTSKANSEQRNLETENGLPKIIGTNEMHHYDD